MSKFHSLPIGARFTLKGEIYIKTKPLVATLEQNGKPQFIHRSAVVEPLELDETTATGSSSVSIDLSTARELLESLHAHCQNNLKSLESVLNAGQLRSLSI